ncbi:MAG TPA: NBR1-Ig-like domain-containing protein [Kofleriaceae bacterium]|nr:NBR1-Ig-like domain-containing protein [Kofleriaceae bacterium]
MMLAPLAIAAGLDVGRVVDNGQIHENRALVDATGIGWVRINLRLDAKNAIEDEFAIYDMVIDDYLSRGIEVYILINDEAVGPSANAHGSDAWIENDFVPAAVKIVDHFKNRVRVYEVINEPNDYAGGSSARFAPRQFAKILQDTYLAVKHDAGHLSDGCWQVSLVSGPLFSFDDDPADTYLGEVYSIGKSQLAWDYTHQVTGSYPLDGIGYHMYVAQGLDSSNADVRTQMLANLSAMDAVASTYESAPKQFWVSEYGWEASVVGNDVQAQRLTAGFNAMKESGKVATAFYFNFQDFPGATYGIYDDQLDVRPAAAALSQIAPLPLRASIEHVEVPADVAPQTDAVIMVTLRNRGTETWSPQDAYRLAAGGGCPDSSAANELAWTPAPGDGYANSLTDARVYVPHEVLPGDTVEIHVRVHAPDNEGTYTFAARMVHEGVTMFGPTIRATVTVTNAPVGGDDSPPVTDPPSSSGCGCASTACDHRSNVLLLLVVAALLGRRRRGTSTAASRVRRYCNVDSPNRHDRTRCLRARLRRLDRQHDHHL